MLLLEPSPLFSFEFQVSCFYREDAGFEELVGIGRVMHIQQDGLIQIVIDRVSASHEGTIKKARENDADTLKHLIVKPNVRWGGVASAGDQFDVE